MSITEAIVNGPEPGEPVVDWLNRLIADREGIDPSEVTLEYIWEQREKRRAQELIRVDYHPLVGPPVYMTREELDRSVDEFLARL